MVAIKMAVICMAVKTSDFKLKDNHIIVDCRQEVTKTQPP